jgi:ABC-type glycerol-3-phosphate transport system substrate-binding protein
MWGLQYDPHIESYNRLAQIFNEKTGATLKVEPQGWPLEPKILASISAGTVPDVCCVMPQWNKNLIIQKAFMPLDDLVFKPMGIGDVNKTFVAAAIENWFWDGQYYGVPVEMSYVGWTVCIPADDVKALGLDKQYPPGNGEPWFESYEVMWELAKKLMKKEGDKVTRWGITSQGWEWWSYWGIIATLLAASQKKVWESENAKFNFDTEEGVKALQLLVETPVKMGIESQMDKTGMDAGLAGQVALVRANFAPALKEAKELGINYDVVATPKVLPPEPALYADNCSWSFAGMAQAKNPDISVEFLKMMCTKDGQVGYNKIYGGNLCPAFIPLHHVYDHFDDPSPTGAYVKVHELYVSQVFPRMTVINFPDYGGLQDKTSAVFADVRQGKITAQEGAKTMQKGAEEAWKEFKEKAKI